MIVIESLNIKLDSPEKFNDLDSSAKNYITERLNLGYLLFVIPHHLSEVDKSHKKAYKVGFLNKLISFVYKEKYSKEKRYELISEKYQIHETTRSIKNYIKIYDNVFVSAR
jgi:hypothetical protein